MYEVNYGTTAIFFELKRSQRKTLAIEVYPDSSIKVVAPIESDIQDIKKKVLKRGKWIHQQLAYFEQFLPRTPERKYVSGETHLYLGKKYVLKIRKGTSNSVKLKAGELRVTCKDCSQKDIVKKLLAQWYFQHAERKFKEIKNECFQKFAHSQIKEPQLFIKRMSKRWGSCTPNGIININPELIKTPTKCIEYLITHEMCHLIIPNHSKAFYQLLAQKMPDYKRWKDKLELVLA